MIALTSQMLLTPVASVDRPLVLVDDGRVVEITSLDAREIPKGIQLFQFPNAALAPAFIDLHVHGGARFDCMDEDLRALTAIGALLAKHGVGSYFPTTITASLDKTLAALDRIANAIESGANSQNSNCARP